MTRNVVEELQGHGIQPSAQRVAIAQFILATDQHPTADQVWTQVRRKFPVVSRATVYNTLHLFVEKGLIRELFVSEGVVVYDPKLETHHHFVDEATGRIYDVPWDAVEVRNVEHLEEFEVRDYQVVMRGRKRRATRH